MTSQTSQVLVVDDSAVAREKVRRVLAGADLFTEVRVAADGNEALAILDSSEGTALDLVLCDLMMPGTDGFALLRHVLEHPRLSSTPVIVLTGHEDMELKLRALEAGAADYLTKPFHDAELLARVRVHAHLKRLRDELEAANAQLREMVVRDPLTGLYNRRHWAARLADEWERTRRHDRPLSLLMADIDHFKRINDEHGHAVGDDVLRAVARALQGDLRGTDVVARLGGEEFGVLLPETGAEAALAAGERLRRAVAEMAVPGHPDLAVRLSVGAVSTGGGEPTPDGAAELTAAADRALYRAKRGGRNRVCSEPAAGTAGGD